MIADSGATTAKAVLSILPRPSRGAIGPVCRAPRRPLHRLYTAPHGLDTVFAGAALSCGHGQSRSLPDWRVEMDIVFVGALVVFVALSMGLIQFCAWLAKGEQR